jgi:ubiquinone/menaquinone biosynthesis C-methylase UbiE
MSQISFDDSLAQRLDANYRTRDMLRRRALVLDALGAAAGERVLDIGCGPGFYVTELAGKVGPEGAVVGVDSSRPMLAVAARRCAAYAGVELHEADATALPVADAGFDAAVCVQVLEYVPGTMAALRQMRRALRAGGRLVVWDVDWATVSWHSSDPARMRRVLNAWDRHLAHPSLPTTMPTLLRAAGFDQVRVEGHVFATGDLSPQTYGGAVLPLIEDFVAGRDGVTDGEARKWGAEQRQLGRSGEFFFACVQFCFTATRRS